MATKKQKKKAINTAKKVAKKNPTVAIIILVILLAAAGVVAYLYFSGKFDEWFKKNNGGNTPTQTSQNINPSTGTSGHSHEAEDGVVEDIIYDNFQ